MPDATEPGRPPLEAVFVSLVATASVGVGVVHAVARMLPPAGVQPGAVTAWPLTLTTLFVCVSFAVAQAILPGPRSVGYAGLAIPLAGATTLAIRGLDAAVVVAALFTGVFLTPAAYYVAIRLSGRLSGMLARRRTASLLWGLLGLLVLVQGARLGTYMADPSFDWWVTTRNEFWAKHMCMAAYIEAADLERQGAANVYDANHYKALVRTANPKLTVANLEAWAGDPFQYPPPFLLLPRLALAFTNDYLAIRTVWYALQLAGLAFVAVALGRWIGGSPGWTALFLFPIVFVSVPGLQVLQYGQFHLAAILLAVGAFLAFERQRDALGGGLLAAAILSKLFPGVLLVMLVARRRWRQVAWTAGFGGAFTLLGLVVLGPAPFAAFVRHQLPSLASGAAFEFTRDWPELRDALVADNLSPAGVVAKLGVLGVPGMTPFLGNVVMKAYGLAVLGLAWVAGGPSQTRPQQAWTWFALLNLAAFASHGAWGDYVTLGTVWLLTLATVAASGSAARVGLVGACWLLAVAVPGVQPVPGFLPVTDAMVLSGLTAAAVVGFNAWVLLGPSRAKILPA
jgi:alpha-1,2-mannosyltransferase